MSSSILSSLFGSEAETSSIKATIAVAPDLSCFYIAVGPMPESIIPEVENTIRRGFQQLAEDVGYSYLLVNPPQFSPTDRSTALRTLNDIANDFLYELNSEVEQRGLSQCARCELISNDGFKEKFPDDKRSRTNFMNEIRRGPNASRWRSTSGERICPLEPAVYLCMQMTCREEQRWHIHSAHAGSEFKNFTGHAIGSVLYSQPWSPNPSDMAVRDLARTTIQTFTERPVDEVLVFVDRTPLDQFDKLEVFRDRSAARSRDAPLRYIRELVTTALDPSISDL